MLIESGNIVQNPVVTIAGITYNQASYVEVFVKSALSQKTEFAFEILISDDCSTDGTREVLLRLQQEHPNVIRLNLREKNGGLIANYTELLHLCRGKYIAQSSCDDFWCDEQKLQKQVKALEQHPECDLCYTNCYTCDDAGRIDYTRMLDGVYDATFENHLIHSGYLAPLTWMIRRKVVDYLDLQPWMTDESLAVALDVLGKSRMFYLDEPTAVYRCHENSAANQVDPKKHWRYIYGIFKMQMYYADKYKVLEDLKQRLLVQGYVTNLKTAIAAGDEDFVKEAKAFYDRVDLDMDGVIAYARECVEYRRKFVELRRSKPYRLGKCILDPIKKIIRK